MRLIKEFSNWKLPVREVDPDLREEIELVLQDLYDKDFNFSSSYIFGDSLLDSGGIKVVIFKSIIHYSGGSSTFKLEQVYDEVVRICRIMDSWGFRLQDSGLKMVLSSEYWLKRSNPNWKAQFGHPDSWSDRILECYVHSLDMVFVD